MSFSQWRPHPWHGLPVGKDPPGTVNAYIELTPFDLMKYEVDKESGYLRVDRPQRTSSQPPALYGFIPRTYCGASVAKLSPTATRGDGDPLDICVLSERPVVRAEIIVTCRVVGGLRLVDRGDADDKIIAVLDGDLMWEGVSDIDQVPRILVERLEHYFATYKLVRGASGESETPIDVEEIFGRTHAERVISAAMADYRTLAAGTDVKL
jgi:inorganic pyrophosphatase